MSAKGAKSFYFRGYRFNGKVVSEFSIGTYRANVNDNNGDLTLAEARDKAREIIRTYRQGIDYARQQKADKARAVYEQANTLDDWHKRWLKTKEDKAPSTQRDYRGRYANWISPKLGKRSIVELSDNDQEIEALYNHIQKVRSPEMAKRCNVILNGIFTLARRKKMIKSNPTELAKEEIKPTEEKNYPAITTEHGDEAIGKLMVDIANINGEISTQYAFSLIPYLMLRPMNVVKLEWADIDFKRRIITISSDRMKTKGWHCVPYPTQVGDALAELREITGHQEYVLPGRSGEGHMCRDALSKALRAAGYQGIHVPHGFRSTASTWLNDNEYSPRAINKQMAHARGDKVERAYNRDYVEKYLDARREMLQDYADYLCRVKEQALQSLPSK